MFIWASSFVLRHLFGFGFRHSDFSAGGVIHWSFWFRQLGFARRSAKLRANLKPPVFQRAARHDADFGFDCLWSDGDFKHVKAADREFTVDGQANAVLGEVCGLDVERFRVCRERGLDDIRKALAAAAIAGGARSGSDVECLLAHDSNIGRSAQRLHGMNRADVWNLCGASKSLELPDPSIDNGLGSV